MRVDFNISREEIRNVADKALAKSYNVPLFYFLCEAGYLVPLTKINTFLVKRKTVIELRSIEQRLYRTKRALKEYFETREGKYLPYEITLERKPILNKKINDDDMGWGVFVLLNEQELILKEVLKEDEDLLIKWEPLEEEDDDLNIPEETEHEMPLTPDDLMRAAKYYYLIGDYRKAISAWEKYQNIDKMDIYSHYGIGLCLGEMGRHNEAIQCFDKVIPFDSKHLKEYKQRLKEIKKEYEKDEKSKRYYELFKSALINKSVSLYRLKKYQESIDIIDNMLQIEINDRLLLSLKALSMIRQDNVKESMKVLSKAIEDSDEYMNIDFWYNIAACFALLNEKEGLRRILLKVIVYADFNQRNQLYTNKIKKRILRDPDFENIKDDRDIIEVIEKN